MYTFIYDYSVRYMTLELKTTVSSEETDMFELLKQVEQAKLQALRGYPYMQQFLVRSISEDVSEALHYRNKDADWKNSRDAIQRGMQKLKGGYPADPAYKMNK